MPIELPTWDDHQHELVPTTYYDAGEVADRLHVSVRTVTRYTTERQAWPHIRLAGRAYLTNEMIGRVVELLTYDPDRLPDHSEVPRRLGTPLPYDATTEARVEDVQ